MPLKKGSSDKTRSANISEMIRSKTFAEGKSPEKKRSMAVAAAYDQQRRSKKKKGMFHV